jgi:hypothetical protein
MGSPFLADHTVVMPEVPDDQAFSTFLYTIGFSVVFHMSEIFQIAGYGSIPCSGTLGSFNLLISLSQAADQLAIKIQEWRHR